MGEDKKKILGKIPWGEVLDVADEMIDGGTPKKEALNQLAESLDDMIDFSGFGVVGKVVESVDKQLFRAVLGVVVSLAGDPERRAERREARQKRRTERRARREARRAERADK